MLHFTKFSCVLLLLFIPQRLPRYSVNKILSIKIKLSVCAQNKMRCISCMRFAARDVNEIYGTAFSFAPNIEPSKTIKTRFMAYDKLTISTCMSPHYENSSRKLLENI